MVYWNYVELRHHPLKEPMQLNVTSEEVVRACAALRAAGVNPVEATRGQVAQSCGVVDRRARTIQEWIRRGGEPVVEVPLSAEVKPVASFDTAYSAYQEWIGMGQGMPCRTAPLEPLRKIVVAGDLHSPFHHREALKALIEEEAGDTDLLVINGDLGDFWSTSRFPKSKRLVDPCSEMVETQAVLALLASKFKRIRMLSGNHDNRPRNYLANVLPPDVLDYIALTGPKVFKPLEFLSEGLGNVEVVDPIRSEFAEFAFLHQIGDLVCTHAETYSIIPNRATGNVNKWIHSFAIPAGLLAGPIRCVVQGHTHQGGSVMGDYGTLCIEGGCLSTLQDYHGNARIMTPRPLAQGWTQVYQDNGVTNHRHSRFIPFKS